MLENWLSWVLPGSIILGGIAWLVRAEYVARSASAAVVQLATRVEENEHDLSNFKVQAAREYVTFTFVKDMEERIMRQFDRLYEAIKGRE